MSRGKWVYIANLSGILPEASSRNAQKSLKWYFEKSSPKMTLSFWAQPNVVTCKPSPLPAPMHCNYSALLSTVTGKSYVTRRRWWLCLLDAETNQECNRCIPMFNCYHFSRSLRGFPLFGFTPGESSSVNAIYLQSFAHFCFADALLNPNSARATNQVYWHLNQVWQKRLIISDLFIPGRVLFLAFSHIILLCSTDHVPGLATLNKLVQDLIPCCYYWPWLILDTSNPVSGRHHIRCPCFGGTI